MTEEQNYRLVNVGTLLRLPALGLRLRTGLPGLPNFDTALASSETVGLHRLACPVLCLRDFAHAEYADMESVVGPRYLEDILIAWPLQPPHLWEVGLRNGRRQS